MLFTRILRTTQNRQVHSKQNVKASGVLDGSVMSFEVFTVIIVKINVLQNVIPIVRKLSRNLLPPSSFTLKMETTMSVNFVASQ
jgi:hypothetical protein